MISNVRYVHGISSVMSRSGQFLTLVGLVLSAILLYLAPVPILFLSAIAFLLSGLVSGPLHWLRSRRRA
jgi:hypothetical protein